MDILDRLEIVKDLTLQRVYFYPQEGRPTSTPSVQIKDEAGNTITEDATTNVTLDPVSTTVSTANAINDDNVILTSVADIEVGVTYLLSNSLGQKEWVRVKSRNTSTRVVYFDEPLKYVHDTAATFVGTRFYRTLQAAEVDELVEIYRARASYSFGGLNYILEVPFDVVLTPLANRLSVEFVKKRRPSIMAQEPAETRGTDMLDIREEAWDQVKKGIRNHEHGWRPALLRTPEDVEDWALAEFDLICQRNGISVLPGWDAKDAVVYLENELNKKREQSLSSLKYIDINEDDSIADEEERPLRMDFIR